MAIYRQTKRAFPLIRDSAPIIDRIRGEEETSILPKSQSDLILSFRNGLANGLGLPPEAIEQESVRQWLIQYLKAFISPEHMDKVAPSLSEIESLGSNLGSLIRSSFNLEPKSNRKTESSPSPSIGNRSDKTTKISDSPSETKGSLRASIVRNDKA